MKKMILFFIAILLTSCFAQESKITRKSLDSLHTNLDTRIDSLLASGITDSTGIKGLINDSLANYVNKSFTIQNITAQKNFLGNAKFGSDSSVSVGSMRLGKRNGISLSHISGTPYEYSKLLEVIPADAGTAPFSLGSYESDWDSTREGVEISWNQAYNLYGEKVTHPQFGLIFEPNYEYADTVNVFESYWWYNDLPSPNTTQAYRPFGITIYNFPSLKHRTSIVARSDYFSIGDDDNSPIIEFYTKSYRPTISSVGGSNSLMTFLDSTYIYHQKNNFGWLYQGLAAGGGAREMMRINASNNLVLYPGGTQRIQLQSPISGYDDTLHIQMGNYSGQRNYGFSIRTSGINTGGSMWWNGDSSWFGFNKGGGGIGGDPDDWESNNINNYRANLMFGGSLLIGTKNKGNSDRAILLANADTIPSAISGQVGIYTSGGSLYVIDGGGTINQLSGAEVDFFNASNFGSQRKYTSRLENYFYTAGSRFTLTDTSFQTTSNEGDVSNSKNLFDNAYESYAVIDSADTGKVYINFTTKSEIDVNSISYTEGYVLLHFTNNSYPAQSVIGQMKLTDSTEWTSFTDLVDISNNIGYQIWRLSVPYRNYAEQFRFYIIARDTCDAYLAEIEYYPFRPVSPRFNSAVDKFGANSLYNKLSFKNWNNTEKAYVDSNGNAYFQDLTVTNTITVTDSVVSQTHTTDTLTVNNVSTLAAATATTLNVGTITSTNGRIQPAIGGQIELDSLRNRVAKLDTLTFAFNISDPTDGSYSGAIYIPNAITINKVMAVLRTAATSSDSAYINIYFGSNIYSGASTIWSADKNVSDTTTGTSYTSFDDATIPTNTWMWLQCNNEVETVNQINITVFAKKD